MAGNPFAALFNSANDIKEFKEQHSQLPIKDEEERGNDQVERNNTQIQLEEESNILILERILLVSTRETIPNFTHVYMSDSSPLNLMSFDSVLFERLMLPNPAENIRKKNLSQNFDKGEVKVAGRTDVITYLSEVYERSWQLRKLGNEKVIDKVVTSVITNIVTAVMAPEAYPGQDVIKQLKLLILNKLPSTALENMIRQFIKKIVSEENCRPDLFHAVLDDVAGKLEKCDIMTMNWALADMLNFYTSCEELASLLLDHEYRYASNGGWQYQLSPLGQLLSVSCLPKTRQSRFEFFQNPSNTSLDSHRRTQDVIGSQLKTLHLNIHTIFKNLLKCSEAIKHKFLKWLEDCLINNSGRSGSYNIESTNFASRYVCDAFMVNLGAVMVLLCSPIVKDVIKDVEVEYVNFKVLNVHPLYCSLFCQGEVEGHYPANLQDESPILPFDDELFQRFKNSDGKPFKFSFVTTCFFLTHKALQLGIQVVYQRIEKLLVDLQRGEQNAADLGMESAVKERMEHLTCHLFCYEAATMGEDMKHNLMVFLTATSIYLAQIGTIKTKSIKDITENPLKYKEITLNDVKSTPSQDSALILTSTPSILYESILISIKTISRVRMDTLISMDSNLRKHFLTFIAVYLGDTDKMFNVHSRAELANMLKLLLPKEDLRNYLFVDYNDVILRHNLSLHFVRAILEVFVSIEVTGHSVAFEEKFGYRLPMYDVITYLFKVQKFRKEFVCLAKTALTQMESARQPIFLRFVNFLINDAIFLLDEGLSHMMTLRQLELEGNDASDIQMRTASAAMAARYHNTLSTHTIAVIIKLTNQVPEFFVHHSLVERIANMLNHFLNLVVGPEQRNLKVRDMEKYNFKPGDIVSDIGQIYINLSRKTEFSRAICGDGRSYKPELFESATRVLYRLGRVQMAEDMKHFGEEVKTANVKKIETDDLTSKAPEEFLDAITFNLMRDPVLLPSSKVILDRPTIARHLLSDQMDPFNRQPLTMADVVPAEEMKARIEQWVQQQRLNKDQH